MNHRLQSYRVDKRDELKIKFIIDAPINYV